MSIINDIIEKHFNKTFFLFLPNICNSACDFCYVNPLIGKSTKLKNEELKKFNEFLKYLKKIGFKNIRITGGEPLIFQNFEKLLEIIKLNDFDYTILTNAQNLFKFNSILKKYPPKKITISFHSIHNYEKIFKNSIDINKFEESLKKIISDKIAVCITVTMLEINKDEIPDLINYFLKIGVKDYKIIIPNINNIIKQEYIKTIENLNVKKINIRYTDLNQKKCLLNERGFLSIIFSELSLYNCCINVGEKNYYRIENFNNLEKIFLEIYQKDIAYEDFPCKTHLNSCPIALKNLKYN